VGERRSTIEELIARAPPNKRRLYRARIRGIEKIEKSNKPAAPVLERPGVDEVRTRVVEAFCRVFGAEIL